MIVLRLVFFVTALSALAACGGEGSGLPPLRIALFGDSTQAGIVDASTHALAVPTGTQVLQGMFDDKCGGGGGVVVVENYGEAEAVATSLGDLRGADITLENFGVNDRRLGASIVRAVAAEKGAVLIDVDAYVLTVPGWQAMQPDGTHPSAELYGLIARNAVYPALAPLVRKIRPECKA